MAIIICKNETERNDILYVDLDAFHASTCDGAARHRASTPIPSGPLTKNVASRAHRR